ncbi:MAG: hypothetical protein V3V49_15205, partial [Candidatus Krumholzibacteria bacterium]
LGLNTKKLLAGTKKALGATSKFFNKLKSQRQQLRNTSLKLGLALAAEIAFIKKVTDAAGEQERVEAGLTAALRTAGIFSDELTKSLTDQASALQKTTVFGDVAIIQLQTLLVTYGVTKDKLEAATKDSLDFAAATGKDLKTAALTVGKAVGAGFTAELSRYGIVLDTSTIPKTEIAAAVLKKLGEQFGGRAEADAKTYAGRMKQLNNALGDVQEQIGFALIPTLREFAIKMLPIVKRVGDWVKDNRNLVGGLLKLLTASTAITFALATLGFALATLTAPFSIAIGVVAILTAGLVALNLAAEKMPGTVKDFDAALDKNLEKQRKVGAQIEKWRGELESTDDVLKRLGQTNQRGLLQFIELIATQEKLQDQNEKLTEAKRLLTEATDKERVATHALNKAQVEEALAAANQIIVNEALAESYREIAREVQEAALAQSEIANRLEELQDKFSAMTESLIDDIVFAFDEVIEVEKNAIDQFVKATLIGFVRFISATIEAAIIRVASMAAAEKAVAFIKAPFTFGASLVAIAPIALAAAAGIAALRALEAGASKRIKSFEHGGILPRTALFLGHEGEVVSNPATQSPREIASNLALAGVPAGAGAGGDSGSAYVFFNNHGTISNQVDMNDAMRRMGELVRRQLGGR